MTCLHVPTPARWLEAVRADLDSLLADHAHCEQKAAASAMRLVARYPEEAPLVTSMVHLAHEELDHFERLYLLLVRRQVSLPRIQTDPYVAALLDLARKPDPEHLVDRLLIFSIVEARSCERFVLLAEALEDPELTTLYRELSYSEAGHHQLFVSLAGHYLPKEVVAARLEELLAAEAQIMCALPVLARMH